MTCSPTELHLVFEFALKRMEGKYKHGIWWKCYANRKCTGPLYKETLIWKNITVHSVAVFLSMCSLWASFKYLQILKRNIYSTSHQHNVVSCKKRKDTFFVIEIRHVSSCLFFAGQGKTFQTRLTTVICTFGISDKMPSCYYKLEGLLKIQTSDSILLFIMSH